MPSLVELVHYLTWSPRGPQVPLECKQQYLQRLKEWAKPSLSQTVECSSLISSLDEDGYAKLLFHPKVLMALNQAKDPVRVSDELVQQLRCNANQSQVVSAPEASQVRHILVDFDSSFIMPGDFDTLTPTPVDRRPAEYQRVQTALSELNSACPHISKFVYDLTTRVAVRSQPDRPRFSLFGSFSEYPGIMLVINPWVRRIDVAEMIEAIVHESIHHVIAMFERTQHELAAGCRTTTLHRSPWSGNMLPSHTFIEACFVWWGVYKMWSQWPTVSNVPRYRSEMLCKRALNGFFFHPATTLLKELGGALLPDGTVQALLAMEKGAADANSFTLIS